MNIRTYISILIPLCVPAALSAADGLTFEGSAVQAVSLPASMGYNTAYVARDASALRMMYTPQRPGAAVTWERFSSLGAAFAEPAPGLTVENGVYIVPASAAGTDMGFCINEEGRAPLYFWICDYAAHPFDVTALNVDAQASDCGRAVVSVTGTAAPLVCYSINGRPQHIDRQIKLTYNSLEYDQAENQFVQKQMTQTFEDVDGSISVPAPYCDTQFTLEPGRFASEWDRPTAIVSDTYVTTAVDARTTAVQNGETADNEQAPEGAEGSLGGSAPVEIDFSAAVTDAAIYRRWEMATTTDFVDVFYTTDQLEFTYTFTEAGTTYVRFTTDNANGSCLYTGEAYAVSIGESRLDCPNAFAPAREGGDMWKVSFRSIVTFRCEIFNRWGKRLAEFDNPAEGWDGMVNGKPVPSGVYFYVIKARGADGKDYSLSGDINVLNSRKNTGTAAPAE